VERWIVQVNCNVAEKLARPLGKASNGQWLQAQLASGCGCHPSGTDTALFIVTFCSSLSCSLISSSMMRTVTQRSLKTFNKGKCQILYLAWNNPMHLYWLGPTRLEADFQKQIGDPGGCQSERESAV